MDIKEQSIKAFLGDIHPRPTSDIGLELLYIIASEAFDMEELIKGFYPDDFGIFTAGWVACIKRLEELQRKEI